MERTLTIGRTTFMVRRKPRPVLQHSAGDRQKAFLASWMNIFVSTWAIKSGGKLPIAKENDQ